MNHMIMYLKKKNLHFSENNTNDTVFDRATTTKFDDIASLFFPRSSRDNFIKTIMETNNTKGEP